MQFILSCSVTMHYSIVFFIYLFCNSQSIQPNMAYILVDDFQFHPNDLCFHDILFSEDL